MPALWLQADGICGGQKLNVPPVRPLLFSVRSKTWPEATDKRRNSPAREFFHFWQVRGFLEAATQFDYRVL
jgi:site-specific recombinase XerD